MHRGIWIVWLVLACALSGCAHEPLKPIVETVAFKASDPGDGADFLAPKRRAGASAPNFLGTRPVEIRARLLLPDLAGLDTDAGAVPNAACAIEADGGGVSAELPAIVQMPVYDAPGPSLTMTCTGQGVPEKVQVLESYNPGKRDAGAVLAAAGPLIGLLAAAENAASGKFDGAYVYGEFLVVHMRPAQGVTQRPPSDAADTRSQPKQTEAETAEKPRRSKFEEDIKCRPWCS